MARAGLLSAALRHARDAEHLLAAGSSQSLDQAFHLAGYVPECARKACLDVDLVDKALGHDINDAGDPVVEFLLAYDAEAARYGLGSHVEGLPLWRALWRPDVRYEATGSAAKKPGEPSLTALVGEIRGFVDELVLALWADGALGTGALR